jgi:GNAT superfamily N-acetyltransferase
MNAKNHKPKALVNEVNIIVTTASRSDFENILAFLDRQGLAENAWLTGSVFAALQRSRFSGSRKAGDEVWETVLTCRRRHQIVGVAYMLNQRKVPVENRAPGYDPGYDYDIEMDAEDASAVEAMIADFPSDQLGHFSIFRPLIQAYFEALPGVVRRGEGDFYFTVSLERFCSVAGEEVVKLTAADAGLFEGCERQRRWEYMGEEHRVFGIVRDGRVATSTGVAPITPARAMKRRMIAISGLYTETRYRRMGLGKRLVSYVTELILRDGHAPLYWTEPDNAASQALAQGLGYWQIAQGMRYLWRKV